MYKKLMWILMLLSVVGLVTAGTLSESGGFLRWNAVNVCLADGSVAFTGGITAPTLNTGQGAYELYAMNQDVETSDNVQFENVYSQNTNKAQYYVSNENAGTVSGGVTIEDGAMVFGGVTGSNVKTIYYSDLNVTGKSTINIWAEANTITGSNRIFVSNFGSSEGSLQIYTTSSGAVRFDFGGAGLTFSGWDVNIPNLITLVIDEIANETLVYRNGNYLGIAKTGLVYKGNEDAHLIQISGRPRNGGELAMLGSIPSVQFHTRALTSTEITEIYNAGKDSYSPVGNGLVAQYGGKDFAGTEASPTTIYNVPPVFDIATKGYTGTCGSGTTLTVVDGLITACS